MQCIIDAMGDSKYLTLGLWGKPVVIYPIRCALESKLFSQIIVVSKNAYIKYLIREFFGNRAVVVSEYPKKGFLVDGCAANISAKTLQRIIPTITEKKIVYLKNCELTDEEQVTVKDKNSFELSLVLHQKRKKTYWLRQRVLNQINEKTEIFQKTVNADEICLIGHSQFDQWELDNLADWDVHNFGISGITTREYQRDILNKGLINEIRGKIVLLIGVNDVALPIPVRDIANTIIEFVEEIIKRFDVQVYYIEILHVNGRLDRENSKIDEVNMLVKEALPDTVIYIDSKGLDDPFGNLDYKYTTDGLHLNKLGYCVLQEILEEVLVK